MPHIHRAHELPIPKILLSSMKRRPFTSRQNTLAAYHSEVTVGFAGKTFASANMNADLRRAAEQVRPHPCIQLQAFMNAHGCLSFRCHLELIYG